MVVVGGTVVLVAVVCGVGRAVGVAATSSTLQESAAVVTSTATKASAAPITVAIPSRLI